MVDNMKNKILNIIGIIVLLFCIGYYLFLIISNTVNRNNNENIVINATKKYTNYSTNYSKLPQTKSSDNSISCIVKVSTLLEKNYLNKNEIRNKQINDCVKITFLKGAYKNVKQNNPSNRYDYEYLQSNKCNIQEC